MRLAATRLRSQALAVRPLRPRHDMAVTSGLLSTSMHRQLFSADQPWCPSPPCMLRSMSTCCIAFGFIATLALRLVRRARVACRESNPNDSLHAERTCPLQGFMPRQANAKAKAAVSKMHADINVNVVPCVYLSSTVCKPKHQQLDLLGLQFGQSPSHRGP